MLLNCSQFAELYSYTEETEFLLNRRSFLDTSENHGEGLKDFWNTVKLTVIMLNISAC